MFIKIHKGTRKKGFMEEELDSYLTLKGNSKKTRKWVIRPSELGQCTRKIVMLILGLIEDTITPQQQRIFDNGNDVHRRYLKSYLPKIGCKPVKIKVTKNGVSEKVDFSEVLIENKDYWIRGAPDAVILNPHDGLKYVFELKSIKQENFAVLEGPHEDHIDQVTIYMFLTDTKKALVLYENKNTQSIKEFVVDFDPKRLDTILKKIRTIQGYVTNYQETQALPDKCGVNYCIACKGEKS